MDLHLDGKIALVTGASRGIGNYIAHGLAAEGCRLAICARGEERLREAAAELEEGGAEVLALPVDITAAGAAEETLAAVEERFGGLDILINNAGGNARGAFADLGRGGLGAGPRAQLLGPPAVLEGGDSAPEEVGLGSDPVRRLDLRS